MEEILGPDIGFIRLFMVNNSGGSHQRTNNEDLWYHFTFPIAFFRVFQVIDGYTSEMSGEFYGFSKNITNTGFDTNIEISKIARYVALGI